MSAVIQGKLTLEAPMLAKSKQRIETAFGIPRDFHGHRFVYAAISAFARGLSIGVNMNPGAS